MYAPSRRLTRLVRSSVYSFLALAAVLLAVGENACGDVPSDDPVFSISAKIDNAYFPVASGTIQVYLGRDEGAPVTVVVTHLHDTRLFAYGQSVVECRAVQEHTFVRGRLVEEEISYYAQADDGSVWGFGQTETSTDDDDDDDDDDEPGGWIVGDLAPSDPSDTVSVNAPGLVMPAAPSAGDTYFNESYGPGQTQLVNVRSIKSNARIRGRGFTQCVRIRESVPGQSGGETKWYAPGVGFVRERARATQLRLNASTMRFRRR